MSASEKITAKEFLMNFLQIFENENEKATEAYTSNKDFTTFIIQRINNILGVSTAAQLLVQNEYFRIDAIKWSDRKNDITSCEYLKKHFWDLEVAVEHENDSRDWLDEVIKLAHICCPLRVVIGYLPYKQREKYNADCTCLDYITESLKKITCYDNVKRGEFLIIIGNSKTGGDKEKYFGYKGYIFKDEKFEELKI